MTVIARSVDAAPRLASQRESDLSSINWKRKRIAWKGLEMRIICPSNWLAECGRQSSLLNDCKIDVIANGIDLECFRPHEKREARSALGLREDCFLVAFGAASLSDSRKGLDKLEDALADIWVAGSPGQF